MRRLIYKNAGQPDHTLRVIEKNALYVRPYNDLVPMLFGGNWDRLVGVAKDLEVDMETGNIYVDVTFDADFMSDMHVDTRIPKQVEHFYDDYDYSFYATQIVHDKLSVRWQERSIVHARLRAIYVTPLGAIPMRIAKELANG